MYSIIQNGLMSSDKKSAKLDKTLNSSEYLDPETFFALALNYGE